MDPFLTPCVFDGRLSIAEHAVRQAKHTLQWNLIMTQHLTLIWQAKSLFLHLHLNDSKSLAATSFSNLLDE